MNLESRLEFLCYVQVVANYCLAFESASQQCFDVIVLPRKRSIEGYSTEDFVQDVTSVVGFNASIIRTVDHDSADHVFGKTVRSSASGSDGYVVDDLVAAIESAVKNSPQVAEERELPKATKRSRGEIVDVTRDLASEQPQQPSKHPRHEKNHRQYPLSADEIAYRQWQQWQMEMLSHGHVLAQALQGQRYYPQAASAVVTDASAATISTTSSISMPSPAAAISSPHNPLPYHPPQYSHYHNSPYHSQPFHPFSSHHPSPYQHPYPYAFPSHPAIPPPPPAQGYHVSPRSNNHSVYHVAPYQHHQEKGFSQAQEAQVHHRQQQQQQQRAVLRPDSLGPDNTSAVGEKDRRCLASACVPVVSEDLLDDHLGHHQYKASFTRAVNLPSADNSSEGSCTTRESLDSLSLDDTAVVEMSDFRESYGTDSIDGAEFAACFDVDTWI
eukprot:gene9627-11319_t